jgi:amidase
MRVCRATLPIFRELGCDVEARYPDFRGAMEVFQTQRALLFGLSAGQLEQSHPDWRDRVKEDLLWNMEKGLGLSAQEIILSDVRRTQIYARVMKFFEGHDFLLLPAAQVLPFDADVAWPRSIAGHAMKTYIDWMEVCCVITLTGLPAISVPGGFSASGLPVGIQIVGQPRADLSVLQLAHAFEQRTRHGRVRPENIM